MAVSATTRLLGEDGGDWLNGDKGNDWIDGDADGDLSISPSTTGEIPTTTSSLVVEATTQPTGSGAMTLSSVVAAKTSSGAAEKTPLMAKWDMATMLLIAVTELTTCMEETKMTPCIPANWTTSRHPQRGMTTPPYLYQPE